MENQNFFEKSSWDQFKYVISNPFWGSIILLVPFSLIFVYTYSWIRFKLIGDPSTGIVYMYEGVLLLCLLVFLIPPIWVFVKKDWRRRNIVLIIIYWAFSAGLFLYLNGFKTISTFF